MFQGSRGVLIPRVRRSIEAASQTVSRFAGCCCRIVLAGAAITTPALGGSYSYTTSGGLYTQNFDTLPNTGTYSFTGLGPFDTSVTPINAAGTEGWQFWKYLGTGTNALFSPNNGSGTSGSTYSYGISESADRALGTLASGSGSYRLGMVVQNNTGETLTNFTLGYVGEQWRWGGSTNINTLTFDYSIGTGASIDSSGAFVTNPSLDFASPVSSGTAGPLDGNLPENQRNVSATVGGLAWAPGDYLILRWSDFNDVGNDDGLALDNVTFTAAGAAAGANLYWSGASGWTQTLPGAGGSGTWRDGVGSWDPLKTANFAGPGGAVTISATATAQAGVTFAASGVTVSGGTLLLSGAENLLVVNPGIEARINSVIAGSNGFIKAGQGTLVLGGSNTVVGPIAIGAGTLSIGNAAALGDSSNTINFSGGSLATTATVDLGSRSLAGAATINIASGTTLTAPGTVSLSALGLVNTGTLALTGFGATVGNISATAGSGTTRVEGSLDFGTSGRTVSVASGGTLELAGSLTISGIMEKVGEGTLLLSGDNAALARLRIGTQGATPVAGGTVRVSAPTGLGSDPVFFNYGTIEATAPLTLDTGLSIGGKPIGNARLAGQPMTFNGPITTFNASGAPGNVTLIVDNDTTFVGDISSTAPMTIGGAGTLRIAGFGLGLTAPVTLADTVTLAVQSGGSLGSSLLTVGNAATLTGDGTVATLVVGPGGTLAPGSSPGTLAATAATFGPGGNYNFQISDATGGAGVGWDLLDVSGSLAITATSADPFRVNLWSLASTGPDVGGNAANFNNQTPYAWTFARAAGGFVDFSADRFAVNTTAVNGTSGFSNALAGGSFSVAASASDLNVVFTPFVPGSVLEWYGNGSTAGGSGTWSSLGATWSPNSGSTVGTWDPARRGLFGTTGGTVTVQGAGIAAASGLEFGADGYTITGGTLNLTGGSALANTVTVGAAASATIAARIQTSAGLTKAGPGRLVLSGANTFTGGTTVSGGTLQVGDGSSGSLGGDVALETGARIAFNPGAPSTFSGGISGSGAVVKVGAGSLTLSGANSHLGGTRLEAGSLTAASSTALGTGGVTAINGGLYAAAGTTLSNSITVGEVTGGGTPVLLAGWDFQTTSSGGTAVVGAPDTPSSYAANIGTGTLYLDGTNFSSPWSTTQLNGFAGTDVNAGPGFSTVTTSPAALALVGSASNGQHAVFAVDMTGYSLLDVSYATRYSGATAFTSQQWSVSTDGVAWQPVENVAVDSTTFLAKNVATITALAGSSTAYLRLTVDGATSTSGNNRLDNVQLRATPGSLPSGTVVLGTQATSGTATFAGDLVLNQSLSLSAAAGGRVDFSGTISDGFGQNGLSKVGAGTVVLGGTNTYAGPTNVTAGTLLVNGSTGLAGVTAAGGTIGGRGSVGPLLLATAGLVSPGDAGVGSFTAATATLGGGAGYLFQITDAAGAAGTGWDLLSVTTGIDLTASAATPFTINLWSVSSGATSGPAAGFSPVQPYRWSFLETTTSLEGLDLTGFAVNASPTSASGGFANDTQGGTFSVALSELGTGLDVVFTPFVPQSTLAWYGNGSTAGGNGTWSTVGTTWWNGASATVWSSSATAAFGKPSGKVTIAPGGVSAAAGLEFDGDGYTVEGGTLTLSGSTAAANTIEVADLVAATISAPLAGTTGFVKAGPGSLVLSGTNPLSGSVTISAGTLEVASAGGVAATNLTVDTGATLAVAAGTTMRTPSVIVDGGTLATATLAVNSTTGVTALAINAGTIAGNPLTTVSGGGSLSLVQDARVSVSLGSLDVVEGSGGGRLDLGAGQVAVLPGGITAAALRADLLAGRNGGAWNGTTGIISSAAASSGGTRTVGYVVAGNGAATVSFAAAGDTNLNGQVDVFDLVAVNSAGKYGAGTAAVWNQGDFNYDGVTNVFDLVSINSAGAYGRGNYFPASPTASGSLGSPAAVPEPAALGLFGLVALALHGRRKFARLGRWS
jgi:fibronectin-binding autotransporter adhesin